MFELLCLITSPLSMVPSSSYHLCPAESPHRNVEFGFRTKCMLMVPNLYLAQSYG